MCRRENHGGDIVPLGEKRRWNDRLRIVQSQEEVDITEFYLFSALYNTLGTILRGIKEEIGPLDQPTSILLTESIKRFYTEYIFLDLQTLFLNYPVIGQTTHELANLLEPLLKSPKSREWQQPLEWVPIVLLCEEEYKGHPVPPGVRYIAGKLLEKYTEP